MDGGGGKAWFKIGLEGSTKPSEDQVTKTTKREHRAIEHFDHLRRALPTRGSHSSVNSRFIPTFHFPPPHKQTRTQNVLKTPVLEK